jgi:Putative phage tail protein
MTNFLSSVFGRKTNPTAPATQLRIQSSINGTPIPIGWGTARLAPNLIYYNDFRNTQQQQGGKGSGGGGGKFGGGSAQTNYYATIMAGLCEGPIAAIGTVWASSNISSLAGINCTLFTGSYSQTAWSFIATVHPADARAYRGTAYVAAAPFALGTSPVLPSLNFEVVFGFLSSSPVDPGVNVGAGIMINGGTQTIIVGPGPGGQDANPRDIVVDFLTNNKYGLGFPSGRIGDSNLTTLFNYCQAVGIWMSPVLAQFKSANTFLADLLYGCVAEAVWSGGQLRIVPYYDAAASANGGTYTPNLSPVYDLTDDNFIPGARNNYQSPLIVTVKALSDTYNNVKIQYNPRTNFYNPAIVEASDAAAIQQYTLHARDLKTLEFFCRADSPQTCAHLQLGREQVRITYQFSLGAQFVLLEPMDLVTLTDAALGLSRKLVRIKEITENEDFTLTVVAEDMLLGAASPPLYGLTANVGAVPNFNLDPGLTLQPFFFEPTDQLVGQLEVMMAVAPVNLATWGGANVYVSYDGTNYQFVGQQLGPTRMGTLTAPFAAATPATSPPTIDTTNTLSVNLAASGAQLMSGTSADMLGFATLCYVQSAAGELLAYQNATPTGANAYNLTTLNRGGYGTTPQSAANGATFVRIDAGVFRIPFTQDRIGQTLSIKLVNFNQYGAGPQTLASVSPYTYTIQGSALTSALPDVKNFTTNYQSNITLFAWDEVKDFRNPIDYEIRRGVDWPTGQFIGRYLHPNVPAIGSSTGGTQYLIKAHSTPVPGLDVYSANAAAITIISNTAVIPLNIVKGWDEFSGATGVLTGTFGLSAYNNAGTIETSSSQDFYQVADLYAMLDFYNYLIPGGADVYAMTNMYGVADVYAFSGPLPSNVTAGVYTIPASHIINVGRNVGCLVDCSWTSAGVPVGQNIFAWTSVFAITDIFGTSANAFMSAFPNINVSSDGIFDGDIYLVPNVYALGDIYADSISSTGWQRYRAGYYVGRSFDMQMFLQSTDPNTIAAVSAFSFAVHIPSRIDHLIGVSVPATAGGLVVTFQPDGAASPAPFNGGPGGVPSSPGLPTWQASILNEQSGDILTVSSLTLSGAQVNVTNGGSTSWVARTINIEFAGY